jgi:XisI protein
MATSTGPDLMNSPIEVTLEEKLGHYRQIIMTVLKQYAHAPMNGEIQTIPILDREGDHYQLLDVGWDDAGKRVFQPTIHIDLLGAKVWIQENMTDLDIAKIFVTSGISPTDIVLGLHSRSLRQCSDYAIE